MPPHTWYVLSVSLLGGVLLGVVFYGGLWLTVRRLPRVRSPGLLVLVSFLMRSAMVVWLGWILTGGRPLPLAAVFTGFLAARLLLFLATAPFSGGRVKDQS